MRSCRMEKSCDDLRPHERQIPLSERFGDSRSLKLVSEISERAVLAAIPDLGDPLPATLVEAHATVVRIAAQRRNVLGVLSARTDAEILASAVQLVAVAVVDLHAR